VIAGQRNARVCGGQGLDESCITHVGHVCDAELYALYSRAFCLLFPSFYEGFGLPPVEAMALGCPAIVSHSSVLPEICADAVLYCDPNDPRTLVNAIQRLRQDRGLRESLVTRGKERTGLFSWSAGAESMLNVLSHAVASQNRSTS
ncbi:MAG TPA: glycosyltransferase, partial [Prosthecobacter sp.]|nr:glycosyltransferase [Prosthecobacter sp.]